MSKSAPNGFYFKSVNSASQDVVSPSNLFSKKMDFKFTEDEGPGLLSPISSNFTTEQLVKNMNNSQPEEPLHKTDRPERKPLDMVMPVKRKQQVSPLAVGRLFDKLNHMKLSLQAKGVVDAMEKISLYGEKMRRKFMKAKVKS